MWMICFFVLPLSAAVLFFNYFTLSTIVPSTIQQQQRHYQAHGNRIDIVSIVDVLENSEIQDIFKFQRQTT